MPRTMFDSVTCTDIPTTAQMVAFYVDGVYAWSDACLQRFPNARKVGITVTGATLDANVADVENGDLSPAQGAAWCKAKLAAGQYPTLYFSLGNWPAVHAALLAAGVDPGRIGAWVAKWDGVAQLQTGWQAKQYANPTITGHHYDLSIVEDYWGGVDPVPATGPPPPLPPIPPPTPPTAGAGGTNLDQARAAWASLGELLTQVVPDAIIRIEAAVANLRKL